MLKKIGILIFVIIFTTIITSVYGVLHNQITYSISSEYFTKFTFEQFDLWEGAFENNQLRQAAFIGVLATWWFGAIGGFIIGSYVLFFTRFHQKLKMILIAIFLSLGIAILFGLIGYVVGILIINDMGMDLDFISSLDDSKSFVTAGSTHNFSYLGGIIGIVCSIIYLTIRNKASA